MRTKAAGTASAPPPSVRHHATVAIGFVTGMLSGLVARNIDFSPALLAAGISPDELSDPAARVPLADYAALYNGLVRHLDDEGFALFSAPLRLGTFEFLCRSMIGSRTLAEALERGTRFLRLVLPDLCVSVARNREAAAIEIAEPSPLGQSLNDPCRVFAFEWLLRLLHGLACWLVGRELALGSVQFPYPRPAHAADYALIYTARSIFDGPTLVASLNPNLLDLPIRRDEEALAAFLQDAPGKITMLYRRDREMVRRVRDILANAFPEPIALENVARELNLSPRTLHRRLAEEGSSFRAIKDALRRDLALSRLEKTQQPIAQIAADLGYSEPSAFFRAFQGWTGIAPTTYRARITVAGPSTSSAASGTGE
jgi:AraC-like DNA-binding protein